MRAVIETLERGQAELSDPSDDESRRLLAIVLLQLQTRLHRVADAELADLCAALEPGSRRRPGAAKPMREHKS